MLGITVYLSLCLCLVVTEEVLDLSDDVEHYRKLYDEFKKTYRSADNGLLTEHYCQKTDEKRFKNFVANMKRADLLQKQELGTATYGITRFSDFTAEELERYLGYKKQSLDSTPFHPPEMESKKLPKTFDWRKKNAVTDVKNQGTCGCCWAFTAVANIESLYAIKYNKLVTLSEQELVDCDPVDDGCDGGDMDTAFDAVMSLGGLESDDVYPYDEMSSTCRLHMNAEKVNIKGYHELGPSEDDMAKYVYHYSPICVGINSATLHFYQKGIARPTKENCSPNITDHALLIVGFGEKGKVPYWIGKNSWGSLWGEEGFIRIYRGEGVCGINTSVTAAFL